MRQRFSGSFMWDVEENVGIVGIPQSGLLSGQQKNPSHDHMLHCGMLYLKKYSRLVETPHAQNCGMLHSYLDHLRASAVLTLQDDNNGAGNDNGIERNRYHCKELL